MVREGEDGGPALALTYKGTVVFGAFKTTVKPTTTVRFRVKAAGPVEQAEIQIWSEERKDNARYYVKDLPEGEWRTVVIPASELKMGWDRSGVPLPIGERFDNFKIVFKTAEATRIFLDDFEILE